MKHIHTIQNSFKVAYLFIKFIFDLSDLFIFMMKNGLNKDGGFKKVAIYGLQELKKNIHHAQQN